MELKQRTFEQLSLQELYEILKVRAEVFVVEQTCPYLDPDGIDLRSVHFFIEEEDGIAAYLRWFAKEEGTVQIGRVLTKKRGQGYGGILLHAAVEEIRKDPAVKRIMLEAQTYAAGFYAREGFSVCSDEFDEDGIPHVCMELSVAQ